MYSFRVFLFCQLFASELTMIRSGRSLAVCSNTILDATKYCFDKQSYKSRYKVFVRRYHDVLNGPSHLNFA